MLDNDFVKVYDSKDLKYKCQVQLELLPSETREPNEIIGFRISKNERYLAVITGKNLIRSEQKANQIFIYNIVSSPS